MFHPHMKRFIVLIAGIVFVAYAISSDVHKDKKMDDDAPDSRDDESDSDVKTAEISNLVDTASEAGQFGTWVLAVKQSGMIEKLEGTGSFTVFAPTDDAFAKLGEGLDELLANEKALRKAVKRHIVDGSLASSELADGAQLTTLARTNVTISIKDGITVDGCKVVEPDLTASNGVIHGIDTVIS